MVDDRPMAERSEDGLVSRASGPARNRPLPQSHPTVYRRPGR